MAFWSQRHALLAALLLRAASAAGFDLTVLHMNDHHSHLSEETWELDFSNLDGQVTEGQYEIEVMYGGYPRLKTLMDQREGMYTNVLRLHAGDAITGTTFFTLFKGDADARMMGLTCFDAFALGNHEFDEGDTTLANFLTALKGYNVSCPQTAVVAANVVPGPNSPLNGMLMNYTIKDFGGEKVGIIGIDTKVKTELSSSPDAGTHLLDEAAAIQWNVDMLTSMGLNKIVLLTHVGFTMDSEVLAQISGVDVIVGGDSHSLLWNEGSQVDFFGNPVGIYPTLLNTANGNVCVVQAWEYAHLLGELVVNFDMDGAVTNCTGMPLVPIGDMIGGSIPPGENSSSIVAKLEAFGNFVVAAKDPAVQAALLNYSGQVEELQTTVIGQASEDLCLERFPGQGRSTICEVEDTWQQGSDVSCVVAKAFLHVTATADIAIQNGGGVRTDLAQGDISYNDAYAVLPFANTLWTLELTGQQVKDTLEEALEFALVDGSGAYPYAYGLRFDVNVNMTMGSRATNVEVNPRGVGSWMAINLTHTYIVVTNSFIATGRDGYTTFGVVSQDESKVVDTYTEYATGFISYMQEVGTVHKCSTLEYSTQSYTNAEGCLHVAGGALNCARSMLGGAAAFSLTILHLNDHHSHLEEETFDVDPHLLSTLVPPGTYEAEIVYGGYPRILKLMEMREAMYSNVAKVHAGDAITGTAFFTLFQGMADAELMGFACFDAFALGNHEFDSGDSVLADFLEAFKNYSAGCSMTPAVVAANVVPGPMSPLNGALLNYTIKEYGAEKVGFIGIDTKVKTEQSSSPDEGTYLIDEQAAAQYNIDMLKAMGVNKIVLVTHIGYEKDLELIQQLNGVDVVVGGDSHSLLLDHDGAVHFPIGNADGTYPTVMDTANGKVCVVQAWEYAHLLGELVVDFDAQGNVVDCYGKPIVPIDDEVEWDDGNAPSMDVDVPGLLSSTGNFMIIEKDEAAGAALMNYSEQVDALAESIIAEVAETLCLERIPGQGRSTKCSVEDTWTQGSDVTCVVSKAFLWSLPTTDVVIQNGGGVRVDIEAGNFSYNDAYTVLPFSNTLVRLTMTGQQVKDVLEEALEASATVSTGAYPYAAGLRWHVNMEEPMGSRVTMLEINRRLEFSWMSIDLNATYIVGTNSFIASGRDGYTTFGTVSSQGLAEDSFTEYATGLINYAQHVGTLESCAAAEYSTQSFTNATGCLHVEGGTADCSQDMSTTMAAGAETTMSAGAETTMAAGAETTMPAGAEESTTDADASSAQPGSRGAARALLGAALAALLAVWAEQLR